MGVIKNQSIEDYHKSSKWNGGNVKIGSTLLKQANKSTRDLMHYLITPSEKKSHFDFGNAFELYLMSLVNGGTEFTDNVAVMPDQKWINDVLELRPTLSNVRASKEYKSMRDEWLESNSSKYVISDSGDESYQLCENMAKSVISNELILKALQSTDYQVTLEWEDELTGLQCKTRPDLTRVSKNTIIDIKSCKDASPKGFAKDACNLDYPMQAFMQVEGAIKSGYYDRVDHYYWLAVEKSAPYHFAIYRFDLNELEGLRDRYNSAMMKAKKAIDYLRAGISLHDVPSYGESVDDEYGVIDFNLPNWY